MDKIALKNSDVMFEIVSKKGHPTFTFHYNNGSQEIVDVRNKSVHEVLTKIEEYIRRSGNQPFKFNQKVLSTNESIRGIWSPFHETKENRHRI